MSRAERNTRNRLRSHAGTALVADMSLKIISAGMGNTPYHARCLKTDRTVCSLHDRSGSLLNQVKRIVICFAVENVGQHVFELEKSNTARSAFSAGLCMTHLDKCSRHIDWAETGWAGNNTLFQSFVKTFDHQLVFTWGK